jgi:hypothetical protein
LAALVDGSSLRRSEKGEGSNAVLTKGFNDRGKGGVRLAAERTIDVGSCTMMNRMGHAEDKLEMV